MKKMSPDEFETYMAIETNVVNQTYMWLKACGLKNEDNEEKYQLALSLIDEEVQEIKDAKSDLELMDAIADTMVVLTNAAYFKGIDRKHLLTYIFSVISSNASKLCIEEETAKKTVELYKGGKHPDKEGVKVDCSYVETSAGLYVIQRTDGKILKSIDYKPAQLIYGTIIKTAKGNNQSKGESKSDYQD